METNTIFLLPILFLATIAGAAECEQGWVPYKDELCFKAFPTTFLSYDEAEAFCLSQGSEMSKSSLVMVKELDVQDLLANYTSNIYDNAWLGGRYNEAAGEFKWIDGESFTYTNWMEGHPRASPDSNICVDMTPINARHGDNLQGKWSDVNCNGRKLVICQRVLSWTLQDAIEEIIRLRKELVNTQHKLETEGHTLRQEIQTVNSRVVPVGSIYIEYSSQPSPSALWPDLTWQDVTSTYAGLFFRASGGGAAAWGTSQAECAPRITQMSHANREGDDYVNPLNIPANGWSDHGHVGWSDYYYNAIYKHGLRFHTAGCEVRPINQAVRIWKRTT